MANKQIKDFNPNLDPQGTDLYLVQRADGTTLNISQENLLLDVNTGLISLQTQITNNYTELTTISGYLQSQIDSIVDSESGEGYGYNHLWISPVEMMPSSTDGAESSRNYNELAWRTNTSVNIDSYIFDDLTEQSINFTTSLTEGWDRQGINVTLYWSCSPGDEVTGGVVWGIKARSISDNEDVDGTWGTEILIKDTFISSDRLHITSRSGSINFESTPQTKDLLKFQISRKTNDSDDTLNSDIKLIGVMIRYVSSSTSISGSSGGITATELADVSGYLQNEITNNYSQLVSVSGYLQSQFDNLDLNYATDASLAAVSGNLYSIIVNVSGSGGITITELASISGYLQSEIESNRTEVSLISAGLDSRVTTINNNYATKSSPVSGTYNNVVVNSQGIVTSGGNVTYTVPSDLNSYTLLSTTTTISGNLQTQIDNNRSEVISVSGNLYSTIANISGQKHSLTISTNSEEIPKIISISGENNIYNFNLDGYGKWQSITDGNSTWTISRSNNGKKITSVQ